MRRLIAGLVALCLGTHAAQAADIIAAEYIDPTTRYPHGVLGDEIEYGGMRVLLSDQTVATVRWDDDMVFEDFEPRLVDLDGDGGLEIITVDSHARLGARLSIWDHQFGGIIRTVSTRHIGTRFRWLAPFAWRDLDGDGHVEIAYIDRPHLAKVLHVYRYIAVSPAEARFEHVASLAGLTNHQIGWDYITGGIRDCDGAGTEMVLVNADWSKVMGVRLSQDMLTQIPLRDYSFKNFVDVLSCN